MARPAPARTPLDRAPRRWATRRADGAVARLLSGATAVALLGALAIAPGAARADVTIPAIPGLPLPPITLPLPDLPLPGLPPAPTVPGTPGGTTPGVPVPTPKPAPTATPKPSKGKTPKLPPIPGTGTVPETHFPPAGSPASPGSTYDAGPERFGIKRTADVEIPMRDGIKLRADVYVPTDPATGAPATGPFPVILSETPYGKQLSALVPDPSVAELTGYQPALIKRGYVQVIVDVRGAGGSEGNFDLLSPTEQADSVEVIDFVSKLPNTTGKVGMLGHSYVGITQLLAAGKVGKNSPLKAIFPIMSANDPYRELASDGGLLNLASVPAYATLVQGASILNPAAQLPRNPLDAIKLTGQHALGSTYWSGGTLAKALLGRDESYDGKYWRDRSPDAVLGKIVENGVAAFLVGGNYDVFQAGEVNNFVGLQNAAAGRPVGGPLVGGEALDPRYQLIVGPWYHAAHFAEFDLVAAELAWFDQWLKGIDTGAASTKEPLHIIEASGTRYDSASLPLQGSVAAKLYLGKGSLSASRPTAKRAADPFAFSIAGLACNRSTEQWLTGLPNQFLSAVGTQDPCAERRKINERSLGQRSYTTDALAAPMQLGGPATMSIEATSTTKDAQFVVTLQDVDPSGKVVDLTSGSLLGSHRAVDQGLSWPGADADPLLVWHPHTKAAKRGVVPGKTTRFDVSLRPVFNTIPAGHRLRVVVATSELPHVLAIPEDFANLAGGIYGVQRNATSASFLHLSVRGVPTS
ncbi:MAG: CocE/NonD family hydrolase [Solirubrobacteraceae bacterium]|nr:CocE/NonD family hydrolase [Solirubrobacteraceae bacterium]